MPQRSLKNKAFRIFLASAVSVSLIGTPIAVPQWTGQIASAQATEAESAIAPTDSINGIVYEQFGAAAGSERGGLLVPLQGINLRTQWITQDGIVSPVAYTSTNTDGSYSAPLRPIRLPDGEVIEYGIGRGANGSVRIVPSLFDSSVEWNLISSPGNGSFAPLDMPSTTVTDSEGKDFVSHSAADIIMTQTQKVTDAHLGSSPESAFSPDDFDGELSDATENNGAISGHVRWLQPSQRADKSSYSASDFTQGQPAPNTRVVASYLSDYAVQQIHTTYATASNLSEIRGSSWTIEQEKQLQDWIIEQINAASDKSLWIAESIRTETNADGYFKGQFKGTHGAAWNDPGSAPSELVGTVASDKWVAGNQQRHINTDWLLIHPEYNLTTKSRINILSPWAQDWFMGNTPFGAGESNGYTGNRFVQNRGVQNVDFAIASASDSDFVFYELDPTESDPSGGFYAQASSFGTGQKLEVQLREYVEHRDYSPKFAVIVEQTDPGQNPRIIARHESTDLLPAQGTYPSFNSEITASDVPSEGYGLRTFKLFEYEADGTTLSESPVTVNSFFIRENPSVSLVSDAPETLEFKAWETLAINEVEYLLS